MALWGADEASAWLPAEKSTDSSGSPKGIATRADVRKEVSPTSVSFSKGFAANTRNVYVVSSARAAPNKGRSNISDRLDSAL